MLAKTVAGMGLVALVMSLACVSTTSVPVFPPPPPVTPAPAPARAVVSPTAIAAIRSAADPLPTSLPALLDLLATFRDEVRELIDRGQLGTIYVPALAAKDVALALEDHAAGLTDRDLVRATAAVRRVVLEAWNLDAYGDRGDLEPVMRAFTALDAAAVELKDMYEAGR
jgi:hypothetical protein